MGSLVYNDTISNVSVLTWDKSGTLTSAYATAVFDYFDDSPAVDDCIYFGKAVLGGYSDLTLNVGTPLVGTDVVIVWEYYHGILDAWVEIPNLTDNTNGFSTSGENTVVFPAPAYMYRTTIGSFTNHFWIRARLVSFTSISEGGANQSSIPTHSDGYVTATGYTSESPLTATELYEWIQTNYPYIPAVRRGAYFEFPFPVTLSQFYSSREVLLFGNGAQYVGFNFRDSQFGEPNAESGMYGSVLMVCGQSGGTALGLRGTKLYNTKVFGQTYEDMDTGSMATYSTAYITTRAPYTSTICYGSIIEEPGYINDDTKFVNTISTGSLRVSLNDRVDSDNLKGAVWAVNNGYYAVNAYYDLQDTYRDVIFDMAVAEAYLFPNQTTYGNLLVKFINCQPALPEPSPTKPHPVKISTPSDINPTAVHYYDSVADTYTNYTSQSIADAGEVPLSGEVGDCYYFAYPASTVNLLNYSIAYKFMFTDQVNDYEYTWEWWDGAEWIIYTEVFDNTDNFQTGNNWLFLHYTTETTATFQPQVINGISGRYTRARITKKGTAAPVYSRLYANQVFGHNEGWRLQELFSFDLKLIDFDGNSIEGANVILNDNLGTELINENTDSNGTITTTDVLYRYFMYDYTNASGDYTKQILMSPHSLTISAPGYQTYTSELDMSSKKDLVIKLEKAVKWIAPGGDNVYWNGKPTDPQNKLNYTKL